MVLSSGRQGFYERRSVFRKLTTFANSSPPDVPFAHRAIVNFGCSSCAPLGYLNVDGSLGALLAQLPLPAAAFGHRAEMIRAMRIGRVRYNTARRLRFATSSLDGFYASHVLEHVSRIECRHLLARVRTWLKPSGLLRVVLPDLRMFAREYIGGRLDANRLVELSGLAVDSLSPARAIFGHTHHRWMYDADSTAELLRSLGYSASTARAHSENSSSWIDAPTGPRNHSIWRQRPEPSIGNKMLRAYGPVARELGQ